MPRELAALEKLPWRPLSVAEGRSLSDQESASSWIRPESVILREGAEFVDAAVQAAGTNPSSAAHLR